MANDKVVWDSELSGHLPEAGAFFITTGKSAAAGGGADSSGAGTKSTYAPERNTDSKPWSPWGADNLWPQNTIALVSKNTVAPPALAFKAKAMYGKGVKPVLVEMNPDGTEKITPVIDPVILEFFRVNKVQKLMREIISDFVWFNNAFPEIILNKRRDKIVRMYVNEAAECRWAKRNPNNGYIERCYVASTWPSPRVNELKSVPALDAYDALDQLASGSAYKYVVPVSTPSPGKSYYQSAMWEGAVTNGWIEIANEIPQFKKAMFKNQMTIKYLIKIPYDYWERLFKEGNVTTPEGRKTLMTEKLQEVNDFLTGTSNSGKAFVSHFGTDPMTKKELPGWQIEAIDDKFKDGKWLPDSAAANSEILFSMHVDPSIFGAGMPGGVYSGSSGSGSDKRESFLITTALLQPERDAIVEPLNLIRDFNGWDKRIQFRFEDVVLTTLDTGAGTKKVLS